MEATWKPHEKHGELTERSDLPDSVFAFPKQRKEPLTDASHVRNAIARFDQTIGVSDEAGEVLALFRMADGTVFSSDVAMTKARNAYYFSTREGYDVLRGFVERSRERYHWEPEPPAGQGWAITARTLNFGGQHNVKGGFGVQHTSNNVDL